MTIEEELQIYEVLRANYGIGECAPLSAVGNFLRAHEITPATYGFDKLLPLFEQMKDVCTLHSVEPRPGVPLTWYVTLLPRPQLPDDTVEDPDERREENETDLSILPPNMENENVFFHYNLQNIISEAVTGQRDANPSLDVIAQIKQDYLNARRKGAFYHDKKRNAYTFLLSATSADGHPLVVSLCQNNRCVGSPWLVKYVGPDSDGLFFRHVHTEHPVSTRPGNVLRAFAYLGPITSFLKSLAEHTQMEPWNFSGKPDDYIILHQYINYTFYRLQQQDKVCIADDGSFAAFNTGLQSCRLGEDVFAYFIPNDRGSPWKFFCFCSVDSRDTNERRCYKTMVSQFKEPEAASYFSKITDLLFDPACEVRLSSEHIFRDNCDRLPMEFLQRECSWNPQAQALLAKIEKESDARCRKKLFAQLGDIIADDDDLFAAMNERLEGALSRAVKKIRRNYKLAVPCFYPKRNVISMMLPLSFTSTGDPSLVLVCERTISGDYLGQTVLTLPMAYVDARLLCRPGSEWLNTEKIVTSSFSEIEQEESIPSLN